jgi:ribonuclease HI
MFWVNKFDHKPFIKVYTHGACDVNGQRGALASATVYFGYNNPHNCDGLDVPGGQTNQRAALHAVVHALQVVVDNRDEDNPDHQRVAVLTNSDYPRQVWSRGWKWNRRTVANEDLVRDLLEFQDDFREVCNVCYYSDRFNHQE